VHENGRSRISMRTSERVARRRWPREMDVKEVEKEVEKGGGK